MEDQEPAPFNPQAKRCEYIKNDGKRCKNIAVRHQKYCVRHGGKKPTNFTLQLQQFLEDASILEVREELALCRLRLKDLKDGYENTRAMFAARDLGAVFDASFDRALIGLVEEIRRLSAHEISRIKTLESVMQHETVLTYLNRLKDIFLVNCAQCPKLLTVLEEINALQGRK